VCVCVCVCVRVIVFDWAEREEKLERKSFMHIKWNCSSGLGYEYECKHSRTLAALQYTIVFELAMVKKLAHGFGCELAYLTLCNLSNVQLRVWCSCNWHICVRVVNSSMCLD